MVQRIWDYIRGSFWLRNLLLALCVVIVGAYVAGLLLGMFTRHGEKIPVPALAGMTADEAAQTLQTNKLKLVVIDSLYVPKTKPGTILDQSPKPDMGVKSGRKVFVTINSFRPRMEVIPYVTGFSLRQAKNRLESRGFEIDRLIYKSDLATNNVLLESFGGKIIGENSNISAELGSGITLTVGVDDDAPVPVIPKVVGLTLREAKSRLWEVGFNIGEIRYDNGIDIAEQERARVYRQVPGQESRNSYGSRVSVWLTDDAARLAQQEKLGNEEARRTVEAEQEDDSSINIE